MPGNDPFGSEGLTQQEQIAEALAAADIGMLAALVRIRREKGLTQEDVAQALGRDKSTVSRFERLDSDPRLSTVRRYACAIGALIEHRVSDSDDASPSFTKFMSSLHMDEADLPRRNWAFHFDVALPAGLLLPGFSIRGPFDDEGEAAVTEEVRAATFVIGSR